MKKPKYLSIIIIAYLNMWSRNIGIKRFDNEK